MSEIATLLDHRSHFDPSADFDDFVAAVPRKWAVYLLLDAEDRPIQLLSVRNLRYSLKRRLGQPDPSEPSKRVNYRELVRSVRWRRMDSAFEADCVYYEAARLVFPASYRGMVGFRPAWFVHVNSETQFPRYIRTIELQKRGTLLGPVSDKSAAARLIELIEDAFDLCRFYNILADSPHGKACAYKEMGKCPAPCDGTISLEQYRRMIAWSLSVLCDCTEEIRHQRQRMQAAAGELNFELAGKIKAFVDQLDEFGNGPFRYVRRLSEFQYLSIQPGPRAKTAKVFLILPGTIRELVGLTGFASPRGTQILSLALEAAAEADKVSLNETGVERIGVVTHHLFSPKQSSGVFIPMVAIDEKAIHQACREIEQEHQPAEIEDEGILRELQAIPGEKL